MTAPPKRKMGWIEWTSAGGVREGTTKPRSDFDAHAYSFPPFPPFFSSEQDKITGWEGTEWNLRGGRMRRSHEHHVPPPHIHIHVSFLPLCLIRSVFFIGSSFLRSLGGIIVGLFGSR